MNNKTAIIGMGYVGLPLALDFCEAGIGVTGFDIDKEKVVSLKKGKSYISYIPDEHIKKQQSKGLFSVSGDLTLLRDVKNIIIAVPTPLNKHREPDLSFVDNTAKTISKYLIKGQLVVLESTTYPGTTREIILPILEKTGFKVGKEFFLAYSPERVDPNNKNFKAREIPKVVGGVTEACLGKARELYEQVFMSVVPVSSVEAAEASKLLENIFRSVNIALINEMKMLFDLMGIDIWEVIAASTTKPFGFMPFYPGPGLGGHCIPIDPFYLTWKAREYDFSTRFIELAGEINTQMPYYVVQKTMEALNGQGISIKEAKILILGVAYKKDIDDVRESPAAKIINLLQSKGAEVSYHDPYIPVIEGMRNYPGLVMKSVGLNMEMLELNDCVIIVTDHSCVDYKLVANNSKLIIDTRNVYEYSENKKIYKA